MSFLTGFFGQNFGWVVNRLGGFAVFAGGDGTIPPPPALPRAKRWHLLDPQRNSR